MRIKEHLLTRAEMSFAVEGRYTNLRVFCCNNSNGGKWKPIDTIFMRLDKAHEYSAPLHSGYKYLKNPPDVVTTLYEKYGFTADISHLDDVCNLLSNLKERQCISW